jgi:integrase
MASVTNRSKFVISVPNCSELSKKFPYDKRKNAATYFQSLVAQGHKPSITQLQNSIEVRIRRTGYGDLLETFKSVDAADAFIKRVESEQHQGLFIDYTSAANVTLAALIEKYIEEECPKQKGGQNYTIMLRAILQDSKNELRKRINLRTQEMREFGKCSTPLNANREPMGALEWVQLPLTAIRATHINDFIADRLDYVEPPTVDRQIDLISSVFTKALTSWGYHLEKSPMVGVERPKYLNERTRRLQGDEEVRLLDAARQEDQFRSLELHIERLVASEYARAKTLPTRYARLQARKDALESARRTAVEKGFPHIPLFEAFVQFQHATAARRGENLGLFWDRVNFTEQTAYLPTSKNNKPRTLYIRKDVMALLAQIPRESDLVFDISIAELSNAWARICHSAGIEGYRIHDMRHEGISRAVDSGQFPTLIDLQAFSGHRDLRSLSRYAHPLASVMNQRLQAAEELRLEKLGHEGRARLSSSLLMLRNNAQDTSTALSEAYIEHERGAPMLQPKAPAGVDSRNTSVTWCTGTVVNFATNTGKLPSILPSYSIKLSHASL